MAVTLPIVVETMRLADIAAVHEIERLSFTTPWPAYAFEQELTANRLARYVVARAGSSVVGFGGVWSTRRTSPPSGCIRNGAARASAGACWWR